MSDAQQQQLWAHGRRRYTARLDWSDRSKLGCPERARVRFPTARMPRDGRDSSTTPIIANRDSSGIYPMESGRKPSLRLKDVPALGLSVSHLRSVPRITL